MSEPAGKAESMFVLLKSHDRRQCVWLRWLQHTAHRTCKILRCVLLFSSNHNVNSVSLVKPQTVCYNFTCEENK